MNLEKQNRVQQYFNQKIQQSKQQVSLLQSEERFDEANLERIRSNVFDIFKTIFSSSLKESSEEAQIAFLKSRIQTIPENWSKALQAAKLHNDDIRIYQEKLKLDTISEIRNEVGEILEVTL